MNDKSRIFKPSTFSHLIIYLTFTLDDPDISQHLSAWILYANFIDTLYLDRLIDRFYLDRFFFSIQNQYKVEKFNSLTLSICHFHQNLTPWQFCWQFKSKILNEISWDDSLEAKEIWYGCDIIGEVIIRKSKTRYVLGAFSLVVLIASCFGRFRFVNKIVYDVNLARFHEKLAATVSGRAILSRAPQITKELLPRVNYSSGWSSGAEHRTCDPRLLIFLCYVSFFPDPHPV